MNNLNISISDLQWLYMKKLKEPVQYANIIKCLKEVLDDLRK